MLARRGEGGLREGGRGAGGEGAGPDSASSAFSLPASLRVSPSLVLPAKHNLSSSKQPLPFLQAQQTESTQPLDLICSKTSRLEQSY